MLTPDAPFPYPGSYALYEDPDRPYPQPTELVRIMWCAPSRAVGPDGGSFEQVIVAVSFPLRAGAGGNKAVPADKLIDATPLTAAEQREFHDLDRALFGRSLRTKRQKALKARRDQLHRRALWAPFMAKRLRALREQQARQQQRAA